MFHTQFADKARAVQRLGKIPLWSRAFYASIGGMALGGFVHLWIAPAHYSHAPAHGIFFAVVGFLQVVWSLIFWRRPTLGLYRIGLALAGGLIILWTITRFGPPPFGQDIEPIDTSTVLSKLGEAICVLSLAILAGQGQLRAAVKRPVLLVLQETMVFALIAGIAWYGLGQFTASWAPAWLTEKEHADAGVSHGHQSQGTQASGPGGAGPASSKTASSQPSMYLIEGGILSPLVNGERVPLAKGLAVDVVVAPYPLALDTDLDLFLVRSDTGQPVTNAQMTFTYQMQFMEHGIWEGKPILVSDGQYRAPLHFLMPGEWRTDIVIQTPEGTVTTALGMAVFPQ